MFHWICPECGREIGPTVRECPACDPVARDLTAAGHADRALPESHQAQIAAPAPLPEPQMAPDPQMAGPMPTKPLMPKFAGWSGIVSTLEPFPTSFGAPEPAIQEPSSSAAAEMEIAEVAEASSAEITSEAVGSETTSSETFVEVTPEVLAEVMPDEFMASHDLPRLGAAVARSNHVIDIEAISIHDEPSSFSVREIRRAATPEPQTHFQEPKPRYPRPRFAAKTTVPAVPPVLRTMRSKSKPALGPARSPVALLTSAAPQIDALPPFSATLCRLQIPPVKVKNAALTMPEIEAIAARPVALMPVRLALTITAHPPLGTPLRYHPLAQRPILPVPPPQLILHQDAGPRKFAPSPMLTCSLLHFSDKELRLTVRTKAAPPVHKQIMRPWLLVTLVGGTILGAGFSDYMLEPSRPAPIHSESTVLAEAAEPVVTPAVATPLATGVEVTGFRLQMEPGKPQEIQYLVINHSNGPLRDIKIYVTLYAASAKVNQPPLCQFSFLTPPLNPGESKEMASGIEGVNRSFSLPDWHDLRAHVEIGQ